MSLTSSRAILSTLGTAAAILSAACGSESADTSDIDSILEAAVERGEVPGVVAMATTSDGVIYQGAFGKRNVAADEDMTLNTIFRIASMTKAITSVAAMQLVEEGGLDLEAPVAEHIPGFADLRILEGLDEATGQPNYRPAATAVTVRHLFTHTAGFGYEFWNDRLRRATESGLVPSLLAGGDGFLNAPLVFGPGERWHYGINTDWLGRLVEELRGSALDEVFAERILLPLEMQNTRFNVPASDVERLVTIHARQADGGLVESPREPPAAVSFVSGGGGLYSTASDYVRFLRALLRGGELDGVRILEAGSIEMMGRNHIGELEAGAMRTVMPGVSNDFDFFPESVDRFGLGFLINTEPVPGGRASGSLAWAGLYNTYFWVDPAEDVAGVLLTQILPFNDGAVSELLGEFERAVYRHIDGVSR